MKVSLSNFLRWGGRRDSQEGPESNGAFWGRKDRRRAPRRVLSGKGWLYWLDEDYEPQRVAAVFADISEDAGGVGAVIRKAVPLGPSCWAMGEDGAAYPIIVKHCDACEEGFRAGAVLNPEPKARGGWGSAKLKWMDADEALVVCPASIRNADEGMIEVNAAKNPPDDSLLLLEGGEFACLCVLRKSTPYGDRRLLEVEPVADAAPAARAEAAA